MATIIWLTMSGGVITAESIKTIIKANFRYFRRISGVTKPIFVRIYIIIGNSKTIPQANTEVRTREM